MFRCDLPINYPKINKFYERKIDHVWRKKKWAVRNTASGECTEKRRVKQKIDTNFNFLSSYYV